MPTYGYRCNACDREFDVWQKMTDEPVAACPTCGGEGKRQFFPAGLVFKGSGFYATDNRRGKPDSNGSGESESKSKSKSSTPSTSGDSAKTSTTDTGSTSGTSKGAASGSTSD
ncbi:MAG: FmdB family zinc ribbon protein [Candidatus Dormibacteria bacterium]